MRFSPSQLPSPTWSGQHIPHLNPITNNAHRYPETLADKSWDNTGRKPLPPQSTSLKPTNTTYSPPRSPLKPNPTPKQLRPPSHRPHKSRRGRSHRAQRLRNRSLPYAPLQPNKKERKDITNTTKRPDYLPRPQIPHLQ